LQMCVGRQSSSAISPPAEVARNGVRYDESLGMSSSGVQFGKLALMA